jgi:predicted lipoprotein with Yx(FWY)xxD motif
MLQRLTGLVGVLALVTACGTTSSTDGGGYGPASAAPSATQTTEGTDAATSPSPATPADEPPTSRPGTPIRVADSEFGPMLFATSGQAIYLFDKEEGPRAECYGACAADWPPVLTDGEPRGVRGTRERLLGTTERRDGSVQVTYGGHPLYFYAHEDPWQVLCHDFVEYGGTWFVVQPDGDAAP